MVHGKENGSAILIVLVILLSVSILGISSLSITGYDHTITGNFKRHAMTFGHADGTVNAVTAVVSDSIAASRIPDSLVSDGYLTTTEAAGLFNQLEGIDVYDPAIDFTVAHGSSTDRVDVDVDIRRLGAKAMSGSSLEFSMAGSGFGQAGTAIAFLIDSEGVDAQKTRSNIEAVYYHVIGPAKRP